MFFAENMKNKSVLSFVLFFVVILVLVGLSLDVKWWKKTYPIVRHDVISYYGYLPAVFIFKDIHLRYVDTISNLPIWFQIAPNGGRVFKTTGGLAMMYLPFFAVGHLAAHFLHYPTHGYSKPYEIAIAIGAFIYLLLGMYVLKKFLQHVIDDKRVVFWTLLFVLLGGNVLYYTAVEPGMSHVYIFCLVSVFLLLTFRWYAKPTLLNTLSLGFILGLLSLIRPTNVLWGLFWLFYDVSSFTALKQRFMFLFKRFYLVLLIGFMAFLIWLPQFVYWKEVTGQWLFFSYGEERFFFTKPHILAALFSYQKGFLVYAPIFILSFIGLIGLYRSKKSLFWSTFLVLMLFVYAYASWWCWWFGGSYGMRAYIDFYPLLAIPMLFSVRWILLQRKWIKVLLLFFSMLLLAYQIFNAFKYVHGSIHWDAMSKKVFWMNFFRLYPPDQMQLYLEHPSYEKALKEGEKMYYSYEKLISKFSDTLCFDPDKGVVNKHFSYPFFISDQENLVVSQEHSYTGDKSMKLFKDNGFTPKLNIYGAKKDDVFYITAKVSKPNALILVLQDKNSAEKFYVSRKRTLPSNRLWHEVALFCELPEDKDSLVIYGWWPGNKEIFVDDFCVIVLRGSIMNAIQQF
jgi:hypothetical protein